MTQDQSLTKPLSIEELAQFKRLEPLAAELLGEQHQRLAINLRVILFAHRVEIRTAFAVDPRFRRGLEARRGCPRQARA